MHSWSTFIVHDWRLGLRGAPFASEVFTGWANLLCVEACLSWRHFWNLVHICKSLYCTFCKGVEASWPATFWFNWVIKVGIGHAIFHDMADFQGVSESVPLMSHCLLTCLMCFVMGDSAVILCVAHIGSTWCTLTSRSRKGQLLCSAPMRLSIPRITESFAVLWNWHVSSMANGQQHSTKTSSFCMVGVSLCWFPACFNDACLCSVACGILQWLHCCHKRWIGSVSAWLIQNSDFCGFLCPFCDDLPLDFQQCCVKQLSFLALAFCGWLMVCRKRTSSFWPQLWPVGWPWVWTVL